MDKFKAVAYVILGVVLCYITLAIFISFLADTTVSVNTSLAAAHNGMVSYPGLSGFILSVPWALWFVPGILGIVLIVIILKRKEGY